MQIDFGLCRNFTFERLDSKHILSALQCVVSMYKCHGTVGSMIKVCYQSSCRRLYFVNLTHEMCYQRFTHILWGAMGSLWGKIICISLAYIVTQNTSASQYSCRTSITCSEKEINPRAHERRGEIKFKSNVQNSKLVFQASCTANCWEYIRISDLKIDFPYQVLSFIVPKLPSFQQVTPNPVALLVLNLPAQMQLL